MYLNFSILYILEGVKKDSSLNTGLTTQRKWLHGNTEILKMQLSIQTLPLTYGIIHLQAGSVAGLQMSNITMIISFPFRNTFLTDGQCLLDKSTIL